MTTIDRPRKQLSPWQRWFFLLLGPIGVGLPVVAYLLALAAGAR